MLLRFTIIYLNILETCINKKRFYSTDSTNKTYFSDNDHHGFKAKNLWLDQDNKNKNTNMKKFNFFAIKPFIGVITISKMLWFNFKWINLILNIFTLIRLIFIDIILVNYLNNIKLFIFNLYLKLLNFIWSDYILIKRLSTSYNNDLNKNVNYQLRMYSTKNRDIKNDSNNNTELLNSNNNKDNEFILYDKSKIGVLQNLGYDPNYIQNQKYINIQDPNININLVKTIKLYYALIRGKNTITYIIW